VSLLPFAVTFLVAAGLLALFLPSKHVRLLGLAAAMGVIAQLLVEWWTPAKTPGEVYQIRYMLTALPVLCAFAAMLGYLRPRQAWQWGLAPFLATAVWNVAGPYAELKWGNLGPIPYLFPFYLAALAAIPAITAAELAAYIARRRQKAQSGS
jgi:hypothetical protein